MKSKFFIGQKVVCIRDNRINRDNGELHVVKGEMYTIRAILKGSLGGVAVLLEEIRNPYMEYRDGFAERNFCESRFAPVSNIKVEFSELAKKDLILN